MTVGVMTLESKKAVSRETAEGLHRKTRIAFKRGTFE